MLYIDQPVGTGFSYDYPTNGTVDKTDSSESTHPNDFLDGIPEQNNTFFVGTFASQNSAQTINSTENAARATWHFAQTWFTEFPHYKPKNDKISIWTESYGGRYGPAFMSFFDTQNTKINDGTLEPAHYIHLDTLGIINGYSDMFLQAFSYPEFAFNNTYGIEAIDEADYTVSMYNLRKPGGCLDKYKECQKIEEELDPLGSGAVLEVNEVCLNASEFCQEHTHLGWVNSGLGVYDISHPVSSLTYL